MSTNVGRSLLGATMRWARATGITRKQVTGLDRTWEFTDATRGYEVRLEIVDEESAQLSVDLVARRLYEGWPTSVVQAVDVLAALGVLPADQSSAYRAGHRKGMDWITDLTMDNLVGQIKDEAFEVIESGALVDKHITHHCPQLLPEHPFDRRQAVRQLGLAVAEVIDEAVDHRGS